MTLLYAFVLMIFENVNGVIVTWFVQERNYRFKKDYYDSLHLQQFVFGFISYYLPLGYVAFVRQSFLALFTLLFVTLLFDQFKAMVIRIIPQIRGIASSLQFSSQRYDKIKNLSSFKITKEDEDLMIPSNTQSD